MMGFGTIAKKVFGTPNDRKIKSTRPLVAAIGALEPEFQAQVRKNIILAGGTGLIRNLGPTLEKALEPVGGGKVTVTEAPVFAGSDGGLAIAADAQDSDWDRLAN